MVGGESEGREQTLHDDPLLSKVPEVEGYKVLEPCVLYAKVGEGGMGAVYRGRHLNLDIDVAIKCLKNVLAEQSPAFVTRFQREARIAASVHHQNLVQVYDISEKNGVHYLVMEYVRGETARERVSRKKRLKESEAVKILLGAASGLAEAHAQKIVHRDIKPDNILISYDGKVKVSDLGLAKALEVDAGPSLTLGVMGTPQYMAPEQWEDSATVGTEADVWALGATFFYLLTGEHAIPGGSMQQVYRRICVDPFPDVEVKLPTISPQSKAILERCVQKDPKKRFADCRELVREVAKVVVKDPPGSNLADADSGTMRVPPLLSPPPADTLGHIRVALQDSTDNNTVKVRTPSPASRSRPRAPEPEAAPAPSPARPPSAPVVERGPAPRRKPAVLAGAAGAVVVLGLSSWLVIDRFVLAGDGRPTARDPALTAGVAAVDPPVATPAVAPRLALETTEPLYVGADGKAEIRGRAENTTSSEVWLEDERGERLGGAPIVAGSFTVRLTSPGRLVDGPHSLRVRSADSNSGALEVIVDRTPPEIAADGYPRVSREARNVLRFTVSDENPEDEVPTVEAVQAIGGIETVRVEGTEGAWQAELTLPDGTHSLKVTARDRAGNPAEKAFELVVDLSAILHVDEQDLRIVVNAESPPGARELLGAVTNGVSDVWIAGEDGRQLSTAARDEGGSFGLPLAFLSELADGRHLLRVEAGNADPLTLEVLVDRTRPEITPIDHRGLSRENPHVLRFRASEHLESAWVESVQLPYPPKRFEARPQDDAWQAEIRVQDGTSTLAIHARDEAGNTGRFPTGSEPFELRVDTVVPRLERIEPPPTSVLVPHSDRMFTLSFSEPVASCRIGDQERVVPGSLPSTLELSLEIPSSDKHFSITGSLRDGAGNEAPIQADFTVDTELARPKGWEFDPALEPFLQVDSTTGLINARRARRIMDPSTGIWFRLVEGFSAADGAVLYAAETEVTRAQWTRAGMSMNQAQAKLTGSEEHPISWMSWKEAKAFCDKAGYELPSPELWRFACLAGASGPYACDPKQLAEYAAFHSSGSEPVAKRRPNAFGLHDMHGNVWEWCSERDQALGGSCYSFAPRLAVDAEPKKAPTGAEDIGFRPFKRHP